MCGFFPCIPIVEVFIFYFLIKKVSQDEVQILPCSLFWVAAFITAAISGEIQQNVILIH